MNQPVLKFSWPGKDRLVGDLDMVVYINGEENGHDFLYTQPFQMEVPIEGNELSIEIKHRYKDREATDFSHTIPIEENASYSCNLLGELDGSSQFFIRLSEPNKDVTDSDKVYYHNAFMGAIATMKDAFWSFAFPILGFYRGFKAENHRTLSWISGLCGFILSIIVSAMASGHTIVLGFRNFKLLEFEPFSFTDWILNLFVGGIASLWGLVRLIIEGLG